MVPCAEPSDLSEIASLIASSLQVCTRLDDWASTSTTSPVVALARGQIRKLVAATRCMTRKLDVSVLRAAARGDGAERQYYLPCDTFDTLLSVKKLISEALTLASLCSNVELDGDDGAMNAVYASVFVLNHTARHHDQVRHMAEKQRRINQAAQEILTSWLGADASSTTSWWWDLDQLSPSAMGAMRHLQSDLTDFAESTIKQLSPRYLHEYVPFTDPPYNIVASSPAFSGSYGIVRQVTHSQTKEVFAQKTFQKVFSESKRKEILREIGVLELCHHRNIVALVEAYCIVDDPSHDIHIVLSPWAPYTLYEFLCQPDTARKSRCPWFEPNQPASDMRIYRMMGEMVDATRYLHDLSIKHKDIKPDNILLYEDGSKDLIPLIADVGISKVYRPGAQTNYTRSSYTYLALEQLEKRESSLKADIWQLGCCFAMFLTVARGGTAALDRLWSSFEYTAEVCSCNIALESKRFMATFEDICLPGHRAQELMFSVISRMLELNPAHRLDIETVKMQLGKLPSDWLETEP